MKFRALTPIFPALLLAALCAGCAEAPTYHPGLTIRRDAKGDCWQYRDDGKWERIEIVYTGEVYGTEQ